MKKDIKFSTRMASADREAIKELAMRSGMSMSDYVTACCLGKQVVIVDGLKEVLKELKAIGRNCHPGAHGARHSGQSGQRAPGVL